MKNSEKSNRIAKAVASDSFDYLDDNEISKKMNILKRKNVPESVLRKLYLDENQDVRVEVAKHSCTPVDILKKMLSDDSIIVKFEAEKSIKKKK